MWPRLGPIPTYAILYSVGILSHYLIGYLLAKRLGLRHVYVGPLTLSQSICFAAAGVSIFLLYVVRRRTWLEKHATAQASILV